MIVRIPSRLICGGNVTVYFQYFDPADENGRALLQGILELLRGDDDSWLVYRMDGGCVSAMGTFDEAHGLRFTDCITPEALRPMLLSNAFTKKGDPGYYIEPLTQAGHAYIFGGGHVGMALAPVLASVGFRVVVYDNRPDFAKPDHYPSAEQVILGDYLDIGAHLTLTENDYVCIMTPGHQADRAVLLQALRSPATYIGCIGNGGPFNIMQLKVIQEAVSLTVFTVIVTFLFKGQPIQWNHLAAFFCLIMAVFFVFLK